MAKSPLLKSSFDFLKELEQNNNRDWFKVHKSRYDIARANVAETADVMLQELVKHDHISTVSGAKSLYRIYRDVRFSKDKSPYKLWYSAYFRRATEELRGGYFFRLKPGGESEIAGGFWGPNKEDLKLIRAQIALDDEPLRTVIESKKFKKYFGSMQGEQLKSAPKGYDKTHPAIDLLNYKQFILSVQLSDKEVLSASFTDQVTDIYLAMRPFLDVMSMYLTTDLNGEPIKRGGN